MSVIVGVRPWAVGTSLAMIVAAGISAYVSTRPKAPPLPLEQRECRSEAKVRCGDFDTWYCEAPQRMRIYPTPNAQCTLLRCACPGDVDYVPTDGGAP